MKKRKCTSCKRELELSTKNFCRVKTRNFGGFTYRCKECQNSFKKDRYEQRKQYHIEYQKQWVALNPEKARAQYMMSKAIKQGFIVRQPCEQCGNPKSLGHHDDYSKPLSVRWLCAKHHRQFHASLIKTN